MAEPITKVYDDAGRIIHSCVAADCAVSWDGYVLTDGYVQEAPDPKVPGAVVTTTLARGDRVQGGTDPGDEWDTSTPGIARLRPASG